MVKRGQSELYVLQPEQVRDLVAAAGDDLVDRVLVKVPLYAGLRISELCHLRRSWLVGQHEVRVPPSMWCSCSQCLKRGGEWRPKTKAGARVIPLVPQVRDDVLAFLHYQPQGLGMSRFIALRRIKRVMKRARIVISGLGDDTGFAHALRATCASMLAAAGLNEAQLAYLMGWGTLEPARHYVRLSRAREGAAAAMERAFNQ